MYYYLHKKKILFDICLLVILNNIKTIKETKGYKTEKILRRFFTIIYSI